MNTWHKENNSITEITFKSTFANFCNHSFSSWEFLWIILGPQKLSERGMSGSFGVEFLQAKCHCPYVTMMLISQYLCHSQLCYDIYHQQCCINDQYWLQSENRKKVFCYWHFWQEFSLNFLRQLNGSMKEPNILHNYEIEKIIHKASDSAEILQLYRVVRFSARDHYALRRI